MLILYVWLLCQFVHAAGTSHVHTSFKQDVSEHGFSWEFRVTNPSVGQNMYWVVVPNEFREMHLHDVQDGLHRAGNSCFGHVTQQDEQKHTVQVQCNLVAGEIYRFFLANEESGNEVERGIELHVPEKKPEPQATPPQGYQQKPKTTAFISTLPALDENGNHPNGRDPNSGMTSTKSALGVWTAKPTLKPSVKPTLLPTRRPTTRCPTEKPSLQPTRKPSLRPTHKPSVKPTLKPTLKPSLKPSFKPTLIPSGNPTQTPTGVPTDFPTLLPSLQPSLKPTLKPSLKPSFKPSFKPTLIPTPLPTTTLSPTKRPTLKPVTTNSPSIAPFGLEIGDKVNANGQSGCVVGLRPTFAIALEDKDKGTYLYHMDVAPPLIQRAGCLLDAMDDNATTLKPTKAPTTTTLEPSLKPSIEVTPVQLTIEPIAPDSPTNMPTTTTGQPTTTLPPTSTTTLQPTTTTEAVTYQTMHLTHEPVVHQGPTEPIQQILDMHITDEPLPTEAIQQILDMHITDEPLELQTMDPNHFLDLQITNDPEFLETQPPDSTKDDGFTHELHFEDEPFKLQGESVSEETKVSVVGVWKTSQTVYTLGAFVGAILLMAMYQKCKGSGDHYEHNIHLLVDLHSEEEY